MMTDTMTGLSYTGRKTEMQTEMQYLDLCTHEAMALMDDTYKGYTVTQVSVGGHYDGSRFVESLVGISSDPNKVIYHCPPLTVKEQENVIRYTSNSDIFCELDVTSNARLNRQFVTVEKNGRLFLSADHFPSPRVSSGEDGDYHCLHCTGWPPGLPYLNWFSSLNKRLVEQAFTYEIIPVTATKWELRFFTMENFIIKCIWTREARKAYYIFKCLLKRHDHISKYVTSYIMKNIMFLAQERMMTMNISKFEVYLMGLLDDLLHCFVEGCLPMYFVRSVNLLASIPCKEMGKIAKEISILRQKLHNPSKIIKGMGSWDKNSINQIMQHYALVNIRRDLNEGKFEELGDLHAIPQTVLFIWESYIYKALRFIETEIGNKIDDSFVHQTMIFKHSLFSFYQVWVGFIQYAMLKGKLLGYKEDKITYDYKPPGLLGTTEPRQLFYIIYNGTYFDMCQRQMTLDDYDRHTVKCLSEVAEVFYDCEAEITVDKEEKHFRDALVNVCWLLNMINCTCCYNQVKLKSLPSKCQISWSGKWVMLRIEEDVRKSLYGELKYLYSDPETILYMTQSYFNLAGQIIDPDLRYFALKSMLSIRGRQVFADMWKWFLELGSTHPGEFGLEKTNFSVPQDGQVSIYQMGFDGFQHTIFATEFALIDKKLSKNLKKINENIYFNLEIKRVDEDEATSAKEAMLESIQHNMKPIDLEHAVKEAMEGKSFQTRHAHVIPARSDPYELKCRLNITKRKSPTNGNKVKIINFCRYTHDPTTGITSENLRSKVLSELPFLLISAHEDLALSDDTYKDIGVTELLCGSEYDGSGFIQRLLNISTDYDRMIYRTCPLTKEEQVRIIKYIPGSPIYCKLDVTDHIRMQVEFPTINDNGRKFLSAKHFRHSRRETVESHRNITGDNVLRTEDIAGKASEVEYHKGGSQQDSVHCIPCIGWPIGIPEITLLTRCEQIRNLLQYHLVPKCSPGGEADLEWRISFSVIEHTLIKTTWSREERLAYALFKCLVKRHVNLPEQITTYHLKNIMFLAHDKLARGRVVQFQNHLLAVLDDLLHCLVEGHLQMFFVKSVDLFEHVPHGILQQAAQKVSVLRQGLVKHPGHLGVFDQSLTQAEMQLLYHKIIREYMLSVIRKDMNEGKFVELCDLHANPETMLYLWESYMHKGLEFIEDPRQGKVHQLMMCNSFLDSFATVWRGFIDYAFCKAELLGYKSSRGIDPDKYREPGLLSGSKKVYYIKYNGAYFEIGDRKMGEAEFEYSKFNSCILPYTNTYFSYVPEIISKPEISTEEESNICDVINNITCICFMYFGMKNSSVSSKLIWAFRWLKLEIQKDMNQGSFLRLGSLVCNPDAAFYIMQPYLRFLSTKLDINENMLTDRILNTEEGNRLVSEIHQCFVKTWSFMVQNKVIR